MSKTKKITALIISAVLICTALTGCGAGEFSENSLITVISRESGSGTRDAFIELFGVQEKDADGNKTDRTVETADINGDTGIVLTNVAGNQNAIGYISLGAMNDTVKALSIDGAEATAENAANGTYKITRPFNIAVGADLSAVAEDFIKFILSAEGQAIVTERGYIALDGAESYSGSRPEGKVTVSGSSSVTPLIEKLKEAYTAVNENAAVEIQQSDSSAGIADAAKGISDIGMASRELKESEKEKGLTSIKICMDGIAVIVNKSNTIDGLTTEQVRSIYTGEVEKWAELR